MREFSPVPTSTMTRMRYSTKQGRNILKLLRFVETGPALTHA